MMTKLFELKSSLGKTPNFNMDVDINDLYCSFGHIQERFLRETTAAKCLSQRYTAEVLRVLSSQVTCKVQFNKNRNAGSKARWSYCGETSVQYIGGNKYIPMIS